MSPPKDNVRRLLKHQQRERNKATKVTHPFAKYDDTGKLTCIVCNSPVKNEAVWQAHLGSTVHRDNIQKLKALKQQQQNLKRRAPSPPAQDTTKRTRIEQEEEDKQDIELDEEVQSSSDDEEMALPSDFFDKEQEEEVVEEEEEESNGPLPTGFFDDPEEEARIQGTLAPEEQAKLNLEKEVAMFNEAMVEVTQESKQVQEEDDETFWIDRHQDLTTEQAAFDSRVEKLKQMRQSGRVTDMAMDTSEEEEGDDGIRIELKTSVRQLLKSKPVQQTESMFDDDEEESESEEEEDWRAQQL